MHQTVEQALQLIDKLQPKRAWFTHIAHDLPHAETNERLRKLGYPHVQLAYDGLQFEVATESPAVERAAKVLAVHVYVPPGRLTALYSGEDWAARYSASGRGSIVAIGNFDGIHQGHQRVLGFTLTMAKDTGAVATALTFEPPPLKVLRPDTAPLRISALDRAVRVQATRRSSPPRRYFHLEDRVVDELHEVRVALPHPEAVRLLRDREVRDLVLPLGGGVLLELAGWPARIDSSVVAAMAFPCCTARTAWGNRRRRGPWPKGPPSPRSAPRWSPWPFRSSSPSRSFRLLTVPFFVRNFWPVRK